MNENVFNKKCINNEEKEAIYISFLIKLYTTYVKILLDVSFFLVQIMVYFSLTSPKLWMFKDEMREQYGR